MSSWGIRDGSLWLDDWKVPLKTIAYAVMCWLKLFSVFTNCMVKLLARHQVLFPMKTEDGDSRTGLLESTSPGGMLMSKTFVAGDKEGGFWVKAVKL